MGTKCANAGSSSSAESARLPLSDYCPAFFACAVHVLAIAFVLQTFTEPAFDEYLGWTSASGPTSWDAAVACALILFITWLAAMMRFQTTSAVEAATWRCLTPLGLHLAYGITRAHGWRVAGAPAPAGRGLVRLLRCIVDCTIHACGVAATLLVVGASELGSDRTSANRALLWLGVVLSVLFLSYTASLHAKARPDAPSALPLPPASGVGERISHRVAAIRPALHTSRGALLGAFAQLLFSAGTIAAVLSGLPRGVQRWHLPTAMLALSVAELNPPIRSRKRRGGWCSLIALGILASGLAFVGDTAGLALELLMLVCVLGGLLDIGRLKAVVERQLTSASVTPGAGSPTGQRTAPASAAAGWAASCRGAWRTALLTLCWALTAAPLAVIGVLVDLRFFGVRPTREMRRLSLYRRLLLYYFAAATTTLAFVAWTAEVGSPWAILNRTELEYAVQQGLQTINMPAGGWPSATRALVLVCCLPPLALVDLCVTMLQPTEQGKATSGDELLRRATRRRTRKGSSNDSLGSVAESGTPGDSVRSGTSTQSAASGGSSPLSAAARAAARKLQTRSRLLSRRVLNDASVADGPGVAWATFDLGKLLMSLKKQRAMLEDARAQLRRDSSGGSDDSREGSGHGRNAIERMREHHAAAAASRDASDGGTQLVSGSQLAFSLGRGDSTESQDSEMGATVLPMVVDAAAANPATAPLHPVAPPAGTLAEGDAPPMIKSCSSQSSEGSGRAVRFADDGAPPRSPGVRPGLTHVPSSTSSLEGLGSATGGGGSPHIRPMHQVASGSSLASMAPSSGSELGGLSRSGSEGSDHNEVAVSVIADDKEGAASASAGGRCGAACLALTRCVRRALCWLLASFGVCCCAVCVVLAIFALTMNLATKDLHAEAWAARHQQLRGVNLGGWLLQERWLTGKRRMVETRCCGEVVTPFDLSAPWDGDDERDVSLVRRRTNTTSRLVDFRAAFISRADFAQMHAYGLNSVRLPFGWWVLTDSEEASWPYIRGRGLGYLDDCVAWAREFNLTVMLDMHGGVGSQNGKQTSGYEDPSWRDTDFDVNATLALVEKVAARYAHEPHVIALELLNEPELPPRLLLDYYQRCSDAVRKHMPPQRVALVINLFRLWHVLTEAYLQFNWYMPSSRYPNLVYDLHLYYAFVFVDDVTLATLTSELFVEGQSIIMSLTGRPAFVGEWSLAVPWYGVAASEWRDINRQANGSDVIELRTDFAKRQIDAITRARRLGGYFWTWHAPFTTDKPMWSFHDQVAEGIIKPGQWAAPPHELVVSI